ncbi:MAG: leucine-rich repeat domain-containing protein [Candidatus Thorarchaeota archaeon]
MSLDWVKDIPDITRIDVSSNRLSEVDLQILKKCKMLDYVSIANNRLENVDLSPLSKLKELCHLDISFNQMKTIDLSPLADCENLKYIYMQENDFEEVNIAPIRALENLVSVVIERHPPPRIIIDHHMSDKPPNLNDEFFSFLCGGKSNLVPEWIHYKDTVIEYSPQPYLLLVKQFGWSRVKKHLLHLVKKLSLRLDFESQKVLLNAFHMPELACYDEKVSDIIERLPTKGSYEDGIKKLYNDVVSLLESQLIRKGSTLFFDIDTLSRTSASVLVPSLLKRREEEMKEVVLLDRNGTIDLLSLWITSFGHEILKVLDYIRTTNTSGLVPIQEALKEINHDVEIKTTDRPVSSKHRIGTAILTYIEKLVGP